MARYFAFRLDELFDLTASGDYWVTVRLSVADAAKTGMERYVTNTTLTSNQVSFKVIKDNPIRPILVPLNDADLGSTTQPSK